MTTATELAAMLDRLGVEFAFGYPGGRVIELFEELSETSVEVVRPRDEREASVMAEAYGRITGTPAVLAGQGPWIGSLGAIGQMEARLGSSPMVVLTETSERGQYAPEAPYQAARGDYGGLDLSSILDGVTAEHWSPRRPAETLRCVQLAFKHATAGRPGPTAVLLDGEAVTQPVPDDPVPAVPDATAATRTWEARPTAEDVTNAADALAGADRPVIVSGNGVHASDAYEPLQAVADAYDAAVVTSYLGKSTIPETHDRCGGVIGSFGHEGANQLVSDADVLLVVGSRLNPMDVNWGASGFLDPDEQTIIHADVDPRNAGWTVPADVGLIGDATESLSALAAAGNGDTGGWATERTEAARAGYDCPTCTDDSVPIKPQRVAAAVQSVVDENTVVTADSGNNRFWQLQYLQTPATGTYYGSGGVGAMGWSPPAAVSAALTGAEAIAVAGDGGFAMTMTAVETAVDCGLAPTFVVMNDRSLGMVRQMDDSIPGVEFHDTDFAAIADGFGAVGRRIETPTELDEALETAVGGDRPTVLDVRIDRGEDMADQLASSFYESVGGLHE